MKKIAGSLFLSVMLAFGLSLLGASAQESQGSAGSASTATSSSAPLTGDQIARKAYQVMYYSGNDGYAEVHMEIFSPTGGKRIREMTMLRRDVKDLGDQKTFVYFHSPADVRDMTYLVWKHPDREDDRWLYLPALDLIRRISSSDVRSSYAGSDFVYEDVTGRSLDDDSHELIGEEKNCYKGDDCYKIRNVPKDKRYVEFAYYDIYVDKKNFLPIKGVYYSAATEKPYRTIEILDVKNIQGYPTPTKIKATNLASGGYSVITYGTIKYNVGVPDNVFTQRSLRRPPTRWVRAR